MNAKDLLSRLNENEDTGEVADKDDHKELVTHILDAVHSGTMSREEGQHALAHMFLSHDVKVSDIDHVIDHIHGSWSPETETNEALTSRTKRILKGTAALAGVVGAAAAGHAIGTHGLHGALDIAHQYASHVLDHAQHKVNAITQLSSTPASNISPVSHTPTTSAIDTPSVTPASHAGGLLNRLGTSAGKIYHAFDYNEPGEQVQKDPFYKTVKHINKLAGASTYRITPAGPMLP